MLATIDTIGGLVRTSRTATTIAAACLLALGTVPALAEEDITPSPEPTASVTATPAPEPTVPVEAPTTDSTEIPTAEPTEAPVELEPAATEEPTLAPSEAPEVLAAPAAAVAQPPVAHTAGIKLLGATTSTWGRVPTDVALAVRTEVQLDDGRWVRSQTATTDDTGWFVIPLTYGATTSGVRQWRVAAEHPSGEVTRSTEFSLRRVAAPTASTAGTKQVRALTYAWGTVDPNGLQQVSTEVQLANGRWARSQTGTTDARGYYTLPLTYGAATAGTYRYRVVALYPEGRIVSREVTITRYAGADAVIIPTTYAEVEGYWNDACPMHWDRLRTIHVNHWDYAGQIRRGVIVVRDDRASEVAAAFTEMFDARFRIARMELPSVWGGNDELMMAANNTSGFNCRKVVGNPYRWSPHAYGYAVDINPVENPYRDPTGKWWPSTQWSVDRPAGVIGMHYTNSTSVTSLRKRGWDWGYGWDWHHFERR